MPEPITIEYFTDPLCCWCWAFEPAWRRLRWALGDSLRCRYRMAGLFADTTAYHDPLNDIHNPKQVAPQWMEVSMSSGAPLNPAIWEQCPPSSSYPACVAVKAAEEFSPTFSEKYLRRLREAAMLHARNISQGDVLRAIAEETNVDLDRRERVEGGEFAAMLAGEDAREAFREDLRECRGRNIGRYPSLLVYREGPRGMLLTGCRPFDSLCQSLKKLAPDVVPAMETPDLRAYVERWQSVTVPEVADLLECSPEEAQEELSAKGLEGAVREVGWREQPPAFVQAAS